MAVCAISRFSIDFSGGICQIPTLMRANDQSHYFRRGQIEFESSLYAPDKERAGTETFVP